MKHWSEWVNKLLDYGKRESQLRAAVKTVMDRYTDEISHAEQHEDCKYDTSCMNVFSLYITSLGIPSSRVGKY